MRDQYSICFVEILHLFFDEKLHEVLFIFKYLKGLSYKIDFKNVDEN
jgi:hypothetical protein